MTYGIDALTLARTKLKTRRVRLAVTLVIMSLLFAGLVFIACLVAGITTSLQSFGKEGLGSRYLVMATPNVYAPFSNQSLIDELIQKQAALVAQKKALAKKLDITYDEKADQTLPITTYSSGPNSTERMANTTSPIAMATLDEQNNAIPGATYDAFQKLARAQGAVNAYQSTGGGMGNYSGPSNNVKVLVDGKESYDTQNAQEQYSPTGIQSISSLGWNQISDDLLKPFLLSGQSTDSSDGSVPILAPFSAAEQMLGLKALPANATPAQKLERLSAVRQKVAGMSGQLCYRNNASNELLNQAIQQQTAKQLNKSNKKYQAPALMYALPTSPCGVVVVQSDKRSSDEKKAANTQKQFDDAFNEDHEPVQGIINVRVVGILPDLNVGAPTINASGVLSNLFTSSLGNGWFSPSSAFKPGELAARAQGGAIAERAVGATTYYAEFPTLEQASKFTDNNNCDIKMIGNVYDPNGIVKQCAAAGTVFTISAYGNNAAAIADFQHLIWKFGRYALLAVLIIASIIMMGTLGKVIADSRRETAVFRSLGAKRLDISQVYLAYALLVSGMIIVLSFVVGMAGAALISRHFADTLSINAVLAYNAADMNKQFVIFGLDARYLGIIALLVVVSALISSIIPLLTNVRRNPIRDMRDEN